MSAAPQLKYTDRDVRENPEFYGMVVNYLTAYEGEFPFLIDCKMRLAQDYDLSTGMVRGVLNCMRVDPRVGNMPEPMIFDADIIPMPERPYSGRPFRPAKVDCDRTDYHSHSYNDWKTMNFCPGKYKTERSGPYRRPADMKPQFHFVKAKSPSTTLIHRATAVEFEYWPVMKDYGWAKQSEMIVHTDCRYPYYLRNGLLLTIETVAQIKGARRCMHCFPAPIDEIEE